MNDEAIYVVIFLLIAVSILGAIVGQQIQLNKSNRDICNKLYVLKADYDKCTYKQYDDNLKLIKVIGERK